MKVFTATGVEGSTAGFRKFLAAVTTYQADVGVLLGDLTGRQVVPVIRRGPTSWDVPVNGKVHKIDSATALAEATTSVEDRGDYWVEQTPEEFEQAKSSPMMIDLLFKSLVRERVEQWLSLADARLGNQGQQVFIAPGCADWPIIDDLLEQSHKIAPCDNRVVSVGSYQMVTSSFSGPTDWELAREMDDRKLQEHLLGLCADVRDPDFAIFNLQADSRAAQRIIKKFQPLMRIMGSVQGGSGGSSKRGRTIELSPRSELIEDADRALHGVLVLLEGRSVKDYAFKDV